MMKSIIIILSFIAIVAIANPYGGGPYRKVQPEGKFKCYIEDL